LHSRDFEFAALSLLVAAVLWVIVFLERPLEFWLMLSIATLILLLMSVYINRGLPLPARPKDVLLGVVSAFLLYGFFYLGFQATRSIPAFSEGVLNVYQFRSIPSPLIALAIIFPIGPSEEVYWRGLIQRRFSEKFGVNIGYVMATAAYTLVHLPTLNLPLMGTALIGGLVWGYIYRATGRVLPAAISHVAFDLLIFVIAPLT